MRYLCLILCLATTFASAAPLEVTLVPTTTFEGGGALPASGLGALIAHRIEYGTCNADGTFNAPLAEKIVAMPQLVYTFPNAPSGILCVRAFARSDFGEGKPYPTAVIGPAPSNGGFIKTVKVGP